MANWWDNDPIAQTMASGQAADWWKNDPVEQEVDYVDETVGQASAGINRGLDALINLPYNAVRSAWNATLDNTIGPDTLSGYRIPEAQPIIGQLNVSGEPKTAMGRAAGTIGEVVGGSVVPAGGILATGARMAPQAIQGGNALLNAARNVAQQAAARPGTFAATEAAGAVGAGSGISAAQEGGAGPVGQTIAGIAGGVAAPLAFGAAARTGGAVKDAVNYGNRMVRRARQPQVAAEEDIADAIVKSGGDFAELRREFSPTPSSQLQGRGFKEEDLAEIVSRKLSGEASKSIADDFKAQGKPVAPTTIDAYIARHREMTPTPRNIRDAMTDLYGEGASRPVGRLGRAASSLADDSEATQALLSRQETQGGRVNTIINRAAGGQDYDAAVANLDDVLTNQSRAAYRQAEANAQPFNLRPAIRTARGEAFRSAGAIREGLEKAIDLFFEPAMGASGRVQRIGQPISDMKRYQAAREALDQMIETSFKDGKPTRLTRKLTRFRNKVNGVVRGANPDLASADDLYAGAKTTEGLLKQGGELTTRLGAKVENALRGFDKLTPEQKEVYRLGFLQRLSGAADNARDGAAVANQFQSEAVRKIVRKLFGRDSKLTNAQNKAIRQRGEQLIKDLRQESTTTRTKNEFLAGSRTAELSHDLDRLTQGAQTAADIATGRWASILANLASRLRYQIGEEQATAIVRALTETDPTRLLPLLNRLAASAKTAGERQAYVTAMREARPKRTLSTAGVPFAIDQEAN